MMKVSLAVLNDIKDKLIKNVYPEYKIEHNQKIFCALKSTSGRHLVSVEILE